MANWQRYMSVADVWDTQNIQLVSRTAAERLKALIPFYGYPFIEDKRLDLVEELLEISNDSDATVAEFDNVWNRVYDWGDISLDNEYNGKKVCWIATI